MAANASAAVAFQVMVHPGSLKEHESICLHGSLEVLGKFERGIQMQPLPENPHVWAVVVDLPFSTSAVEKDKDKGLFRFRYAISKPDGTQLFEAGPARQQGAILQHLYHNFKTLIGRNHISGDETGEIVQDDKDHMPYKIRDAKDGWSWYQQKDVVLATPRPPPVAENEPRVDPAVEGKAAFDYFFQHLFAALQAGAFSAQEFMAHFQGVSTGIEGVTAATVEDLFDAMLLQGPVPELQLLLLCGMMGSYGLSSATRQFVANTTGGGGYYRNLVPDPRPWCFHVANELDVVRMFGLDFRALLGKEGSALCLKGVEEAVERLANDGSFAWLRISPVLDRQNVYPDVDMARDSAFEPCANDVLAQAQQQRKAADGYFSLAEEAVDATKEDLRKRGSYHASLSLKWMHMLVKYAPKMEHVRAVLNHPVIKENIKRLEFAIIEKVRWYSFPYRNEVVELGVIYHTIPELHAIGVQMAASLLANKEADFFGDEALDFVSGAAGSMGDVSVDAVHTLVDGVKGWLNRKHGDEPTVWKGTGNSAASTADKAADKMKERTSAMLAAMREVDRLLCVKGLQTPSNVRSLTFELSRCYMFKGGPKRVLTAMCNSTFKGKFDVRVPLFEDNLVEKAENLVRQIVGQASHQEISQLISMITKTLPKRSEFSHRLLHAAAVTMSEPTRTTPEDAPSLASIIDRKDQWSQIIRWLGNLDDTGAVGPLLTGLQERLSATGAVITDESVALADLHAVLNNSGAFLDLCVQLGITSTTADVVAARRRALGVFDDMLKQVQCFVTFFCACGVSIDAEALRRKVQHITGTYNAIQFSEIDGSFANVECAKDIPWLYSLQSSELFLSTWRSVGDRVRRNILAEQNQANSAINVDMILSLFAASLGKEEHAREQDHARRGRVIRAGNRVISLVPMSESGMVFEQGEVLNVTTRERGAAAGPAGEPGGACGCRNAANAYHTCVAMCSCPCIPGGGGGAATGAAGGPVPAEGGPGARANPPQGDGDQPPTRPAGAQDVAPPTGAVMEAVLDVQWDLSGRTLVPLAKVNRDFAAATMRDRLLQCIQVASDASLPEGEQKERVAAVLDGQPVAGVSQAAATVEQDLDSIILSQQQVASVLLPAVRAEWRVLYDSVREKKISTSELGARFDILTSKPQRAAEVKLLALTGDPCEAAFASGPAPAWVREVTSQVEEFVLCRKLQSWIPSILEVRTLMARLCELDEEDDTSVAKLTSFYEVLESEWGGQCLGSLSSLVEPVKHMFDGFNPAHLDYFAKLHCDGALVEWLLEHDNTDSFNSLLQVCRPRTDDPRLLKAIASLVQVRTVMMDMLYAKGSAPGAPPYRMLHDLLAAIKTVDMANGSTIKHLENVQLSFEGLRDLFEKETRSPGIRACYELDEIRHVGTFVLTACADRNAVMRLELAKDARTVVQKAPSSQVAERAASQASEAGDGAGQEGHGVDSVDGVGAADALQDNGAGGEVEVQCEPFEYLVDLRSKLIMVEIPEELEEEIPDLRRVIESFSEQLQLLGDIRDSLHQLYTSGNFRFQGKYEVRHQFQTDGSTALQQSLLGLQKEIQEWNLTQKRARDQYYFLNYFTMREMLQMIVLLDLSTMAKIHCYADVQGFRDAMTANMSLVQETQGGKKGAKPKSAAPAPVAPKAPVVPKKTIAEEDIGSVQAVCGTDEATARAYLERYDGVEAAISVFMDTGGQLPPDPEQDAGTGALRPPGPEEAGQVAHVQSVCATDPDTARAFLREFDGNAEAAISAFMDNNGVLPASGGSSSAPAPNSSASKSSGIVAKAAAQSYTLAKKFKVALEFSAMLHLVSSFADFDSALAAMMKWSRAASSRLFPDDNAPVPAAAGGKNEVDTESVVAKLARADPKMLLDALGSLLADIFWGAGRDQTKNVATRDVTPPGEDATNTHDLVGVVTRSDDDENSIPIWVTCADATNQVIDVVLSVYLRRGRLPEPGEILFCTASTSLEDIEILLRRYFTAKQYGRGDFLFCLADIHTLAYTKQCAVVDMLQEMLAGLGTKLASSLFVVSGRKRQVILNSLSQHNLECPPLDTAALQKACTQAFKVHRGTTQAVSSDVNGAGKTRWIMEFAAAKQRATAPNDKMLLYRRLPIREASTAATVLAVLADLPELENHMIHVDIGHIIPACANTVLFELLIVGVIRDTATCRVYHRRRKDVFMLEIPNSEDDKTAAALRFSSFLPEHRIEMLPESLEFTKHQFCNREGTVVEAVDFVPLKFVCKFLRALDNQVFDINSEHYFLAYQPHLTAEQEGKINEFVAFSCGMCEDPAVAQAWLVRYDWSVMVAVNCMMDGLDQPPVCVADGDITAEECFDLLVKYSGVAEHETPNFAAFVNFVTFLYPMFSNITQWALINSPVNQAFTQSSFKQSFIRLMIATARDFASRSVPQVNQARLLAPGDGERAANRTPSGGPIPVGRSMSGEEPSSSDVMDAMDAGHVMREGSLDGGPPPARRLTRQNARDAAHRFQSMVSWENSDHPVAVWYVPFNGHGVDGVDVLTLNGEFVDNFLDANLRMQLRGHGVDLNRDWSKLTNAEGIEMLRHAIGILPDQPTNMQHGYVITVDNLLKMLSISLRLKFGLPVVIMGETGCGKSSLMRSMCAILTWRLYTLNIHGGMEDADIIRWMRGVLKLVASAPDVNMYGQPVQHVVFLDEVNTCNCMGLFNEMICDRSMDGRPLPVCLKIVAACNPYRLRHEGAADGMATGLVFDHNESAGDAENVGTGIRDPLSELVYRVHPLPEAMTDHVFDFGALSDTTEKLYIRAMIRNMLQLYITEEQTVEDLSNDHQVDEQAQRMGINFAEETSREEKIALVRQRMREMMLAEANRRAAAHVAAGGGGEGDVQGAEGDNDVESEDESGDEDGDGDADADADGDAGQPLDPNQPLDPAAAFANHQRIHEQEHRNARVNHVAQQMLDEMRNTADVNELLGSGGQSAFKGKSRFGEFVDTFTELVCAAQEFVREYHGGERSSASLRDVARCIKVYRWFGEHITSNEEAKGSQKQRFSRIGFFSIQAEARPAVRDALIMSIAYCYHSRLPREQRSLLRHALTDAWQAMQVPSRYSAFGWFIPGKDYCTWLNVSPNGILEVIDDVQKSFVCKMKFPAGIALNEALCENVFMILVSVLNQIPIFIIGKPGTSKSLAMELVQTNLQGKASSNEFLRSMPAVQKFSYQCSPLSTSQGIEQAFESARRYKMEAPNTVVVVLLDEVGLAEQSPHLPLKVLHKTLDEAKENESVVGLSNWALDPAKMNRAVHLYRPAPTVEDLALTAEGMVQTATLKGYLQAIAESFSVVYKTQSLPDFWGMREFYSTVRFVNRALGVNATLSPELMMNAILRNYGGRPKEVERIVKQFFKCLNMSVEGVPRNSVVDLVKQNIVQQDARHLMLLTKNNAALGMLFDHDILSHEKTTVVFGSDFPLDKTDLQICLNLQRVKHCMANGVTLVLVHCEALYESMYDLLNQHYTEVGGQLWVRLAFGTHSRLCPIDPSFRVIVVVEKMDAYTRLAPPLLNRFEKQVLDRSEIMTPLHNRLHSRLAQFVNAFAARVGGKKATVGKDTSLRHLRVAVCGYHPDMLCSLCLCIVHEAETESSWYGEVEGGVLDMEKLYQEAARRLLLAATPEAACRILQNHQQNQTIRNEHSVDVPDVYFKEQSHSNLYAFSEKIREVRRSGRPSMTMLMTYAPLFLGAANQVQKHGSWDRVSSLVLHDLSSERDLQQHVDQFFETAVPGSLLLVQCDPRAASLRRVKHAQYMVEKALEEFKAKNPAFFAVDDADEDAGEDAERSAGGTKHLASDDGGSTATPAGSEPGKAGKQGSHGKGGSKVGPPPVKRRKKTLDIVVLVHLPRGNDNVNFIIDFDNRWCYAFIDSIMPARNQGLLDVEEMMGVTMSQMLDSVDLAKVLGSNFRFAMARLVYMYERSNDDVRDQISFVLVCLQSRWFIETVHRQMSTMIEEYELALDLSRITDANSDAALAGTFQQALHHQFTDALSAMFSVVLSHMDRNNALVLFADTTLRSLWLYLFQKSFKDMCVIERRHFTMKTMHFTLEVKADGMEKAAFKSEFPFSFFISDALQSMRETAETIGAKGGDMVDGTSQALQRQFEMLSFEHGISGDLAEDLLKRYAHDFVCMHVPNSDAFDKDMQAQMLWSVLSLLVPDKPLATLSQIHGRFWDCESRVMLYCQLLDGVPSSIEPVVNLLSSKSAQELMAETNIAHLSTAIDITVLQIVLDHLDPVAASQQWKADEDYGRWCTQVDLAKPAVLSLVTGICQIADSHETSVKNAWLNWEKIYLVDQFVRDLAVPLSVAPSASVEVAKGLAANPLRTQEAFRVVLSLVCRDLVVQVNAASASVVADTRAVRDGANSLVELYFALCFSGRERICDSRLLDDFICVLAGHDLTGMAGVSDHYANILPSEAGRVALLSSIVHVADAGLRAGVLSQLRAELAAGVERAGFLDTPLCTTYLTVLENDIDSDASSIDDLASVDLSLLSYTSAATDTRASLAAIANIRKLLLLYARQISHCVEPLDGVAIKESDIAYLGQLESVVNPILKQSTTAAQGFLRSMRMYLLRALERNRGVAFVRSAMQQAPVHGSTWMQEWLEDNEGGLTRFMGANKLPQHNPFVGETLFEEADHVVASYLATGSFAGVEDYLAAHREEPRMKSAFALALFHEVGLLKVLPDALGGDIGPRVDALRAWLGRESVGGCGDVERSFYLFCTGELPSQKGGARLADANKFMSLDLASNPEKIAVVRFFVHLAARAISAEPGDQLYLFRLAIAKPAELQGTKIPTMPDDPLYMVQKAMMEAGSESGAKRWFTCPNGHPFAIGNCGGATVEAECPECGEKIGGVGHHLNESNKVLGTVTGGDADALFQASILVDRSDPGYCLRPADAEADKGFAVRSLTAQALRMVRAMLHGCLTLGACLGGSDWVSDFCGVINPTYASPESKGATSEFLVKHLRQDIGILKDMFNLNDEQVAMLLHEAVLGADKPAPEPAAGPEAGAEGAAQAQAPADALRPGQARARADAEEECRAIQAEIGDAEAELANLRMNGGAEEDVENIRAELAELAAELIHAQLRVGQRAPAGGAGAGGGAHPTSAGQKVALAPDWASYSSARQTGRGLNEAEVGEVIECRAVRSKNWCHVRVGPPGDDNGGGTWWYERAALRVTKSARQLPKKLAEGPDREKWEAVFNKEVLEGLCKGEGMAERLRGIEAKYSDAGDEGAIFKEELLERFDVASLAAGQRRKAMPGLWMYKRPFSFDHFEAAFTRNEVNAEEYPVLHAFLDKKADMLSLRHLPAFFRWLDLVMERFDKNVDHDTARQLTLREAMAKLSPVHRAAWEQAFAAFEDAWRLSWHRIEMFGCTEVPPMYRAQTMDVDTVLAFSLPGEDDEGMCPYFLAQYLVEQHNDFVQRVDQALLMRNLDVQRHSTRRNEIFSNFMTSAHVLNFDMEAEFVPYVTKQCVHYSDMAELVYNFASAEKFLLDRYFRNKPLVNLRLRGFKYADDVSSRSLAAKVPQEPLAHDVRKRIGEELEAWPGVARRVLDSIETCINFLTSANFDLHTSVGNRQLEAYLRDDLLMGEAELHILGSVVRQHVQLKHLDALVALLQKLTNTDPLDRVAAVYQQAASEDAKAALTEALPFLDLDVLLPVWQAMLVNNCVGETISKDCDLKDSLEWMQSGGAADVLGDLAWFQQNFPAGVPMRMGVATYLFVLEEATA